METMTTKFFFVQVLGWRIEIFSRLTWASSAFSLSQEILHRLNYLIELNIFRRKNVSWLFELPLENLVASTHATLWACWWYSIVFYIKNSAWTSCRVDSEIYWMKTATSLTVLNEVNLYFCETLYKILLLHELLSTEENQKRKFLVLG